MHVTLMPNVSFHLCSLQFHVPATLEFSVLLLQAYS
jgi:hypothetical protein